MAFQVTQPAVRILSVLCHYQSLSSNGFLYHRPFKLHVSCFMFSVAITHLTAGPKLNQLVLKCRTHSARLCFLCSLGMDCMRNAFANNYSVVASYACCSDHVKNTVPLSPFTAMGLFTTIMSERQLLR
jgi:hypothetical protein